MYPKVSRKSSGTLGKKWASVILSCYALKSPMGHRAQTLSYKKFNCLVAFGSNSAQRSQRDNCVQAFTTVFKRLQLCSTKVLWNFFCSFKNTQNMHNIGIYTLIFLQNWQFFGQTQKEFAVHCNRAGSILFNVSHLAIADVARFQSQIERLSLSAERLKVSLAGQKIRNNLTKKKKSISCFLSWKPLEEPLLSAGVCLHSTLSKRSMMLVEACNAFRSDFSTQLYSWFYWWERKSVNNGLTDVPLGWPWKIRMPSSDSSRPVSAPVVPLSGFQKMFRHFFGLLQQSKIRL